jgi:hypothetical protein
VSLSFFLTLPQTDGNLTYPLICLSIGDRSISAPTQIPSKGSSRRQLKRNRE